jgi:hypothetical protein
MFWRGMTFSIIAIALLAISLCMSPLDPLDVSMLIGMLLATWTLVAIVCRRRYLEASYRMKLLAVVAATIALTVVPTHWPLRLVFAISRPGFERLAVQLERGKAPQTPTRIGPFCVREAGIKDHSYAFFWTTTHPSGSMGFVKCPDEFLASEFNIWFKLALGNGWHLVVED